MASIIFAIRAAAPNISNRSRADFADAEVAVYFFEDGNCHNSEYNEVQRQYSSGNEDGMSRCSCRVDYKEGDAECDEK